MLPYKSIDRTLVISDIHVPYHDVIAIELLWRFIRIYGPNRVIIAGDLVDFYKASKFLTHPEYGYTIANEIAQAKDFLKLLRKEVGNAEIIFVEGNHDMRFRLHLLRQNPELIGLPEIDLENLLKLRDFKIKWHPVHKFATSFVDNWVDVGDIHIGHFNRASQGSGMTVRGLMLKRQGSFIQGHIHRAGILWRRNMDGTMSFGIENPCLYNPKLAPYVSDYDWQMGWTTITNGFPEQYIIQDNQFVMGGEIISYHKRPKI